LQVQHIGEFFEQKSPIFQDLQPKKTEPESLTLVQLQTCLGHTQVVTIG